MALGRGPRESGEFAGAERISRKSMCWGQENNREEDVRSSQLELVLNLSDIGVSISNHRKIMQRRKQNSITPYQQT